MKKFKFKKFKLLDSNCSIIVPQSEDPALEASLELLQSCPDLAVAGTAVVLLAASKAKAGKLDAALQLLQGSKGSAGMVMTTAHLRLMKVR